MQAAFYSRVEREYQRISYRSILYIVAKNNYSIVVTTKGQKICIYATVSCLEQKLPKHLFVRVHRSYIVSIRRIEKFTHTSVTMSGEEIPVSKCYYVTLIKELNVICNDFNCKKTKVNHNKNDQRPLKVRFINQ